jgi:penicillin amidase
VLLEQLVDRPDHPLFKHRSRDAVMLSSLRETVAFLRWKLGPDLESWCWGALHSLVYTHPLGRVKLLDRLFNRGPYPIGGDETTVWAATASYHALDKQGVMVGPVCRFVVDLSDLSRSCSLNAPGQSGRVASRHYADRIAAWFEGDYHPMLYARTDIEREAKETLQLVCDDVA